MARLNEAQQLIPIDLFGTSHKLLIQQIIRVEEDGHCQTASYRYRIETEGGTPLIRWEYDREPPREDYPYPLAHVHVHAEFSDGIDAAPLHISTDRVSLELVLWHLLSEPTWGLEPRIDEWGEILVASIEGFRERRTDLASTENDQA